MKTRLVHEQQGEKTFVLIFDKGDEAIQGLHHFAEEQGITAAHFTAIGAFTDVTLGYFERGKKRLQKDSPFRQQFSV